MITICPNCKAKFKLKDVSEKKKLIIRCTRCKTLFQIKRANKGSSPDESSRKIKTLIATDSPVLRDLLISQLSDRNFDIFTAEDGYEALEKITNIKPEIALIDVGIPKLMGFEICEKIRASNEHKDTIIILIASVYRKMRYKRKPESLYGADDYIERHHIPDELLPKIYRLISGRKKEGRYVESIRVPEIGVEKLSEVRRSLQNEEQDFTLEDERYQCERARRLARVIISDIALYNEKKVYEGIKNDNFFEVLKEEIEEGLEFFSRNVPKQIIEKYHIFKDEIDEFIFRKKKELSLVKDEKGGRDPNENEK